jgi:hypothetical protein
MPTPTPTRNALTELEGMVDEWEDRFREHLRAGGKKPATVPPMVSRVRTVLAAMEDLGDAVGLDRFMGRQVGTQKSNFASAWKCLATWLNLGCGIEVPLPLKHRHVNLLLPIAPHLLTLTLNTRLRAKDIHLLYWGAVQFHPTLPAVDLPYVDPTTQKVMQTGPLGDPVFSAVRAIRDWATNNGIPRGLDPFIPREPGSPREASYNAVQQTILHARQEARLSNAEEQTEADREANPLRTLAEAYTNGKLKYEPYTPAPEDVAEEQRRQEKLRGDYVGGTRRNSDDAKLPVITDPDAYIASLRAQAAAQNVSGSPTGGGGPMSTSSSGEVKPNVSGSVGESVGAAALNGASGGENTGTILPSTGTCATGVPAEKGEAGAMPPVLVWGDVPAATANTSGTSPVPSGSDEFDAPVVPPVGN